MINKNMNGCHNCRHGGGFCEELIKHIDIWYEEHLDESMCNFKYWEQEIVN